MIGFLLAFFVTVFVVGDFYANTFVTPLVAQGAPAFLDNPLSGFLQVWLPLDFVLLGLGWLLFAVATLRARVYPRGPSWVLLVGVSLALVPIPLANLPFYATLAWVGLHLRRVRDAVPRGRRRGKPPSLRRSDGASSGGWGKELSKNPFSTSLGGYPRTERLVVLWYLLRVQRAT